MAKYKIVIRVSVAKDFQRIPSRDVKKILARIESLADDPQPIGAIKLSGDTKYRIRQGNYCILYQVDDEIITVIIVKVRHRRDIYR